MVFSFFKLAANFLVLLLCALSSYAHANVEPSVLDVPQSSKRLIEQQHIEELLYKTEQKFKTIQVSQRKIALNEINQLLSDVKHLLNSSSENDLRVCRDKLIEVQVRLMPSRRVESRGIFLDVNAIPRTELEIRQLVNKLKAAGFNTIYPEVFRRGLTLYQSRIMEQEPRFKDLGFDGLGVLVRAAKDHKMAVYPWIWVYRVYSPETRHNPVLQRLPSLESEPYDLKDASQLAYLERENVSFVSPASPEWRQLISFMLQEINDKYSVDGFMLDYIRYANNYTEDKLSYTRYQLEYFSRYQVFPPKRFEPGSKFDVAWHLWREAQVNYLVKHLSQTLPSSLELSAAVFRNELNARRTKMQNWRHWSDNQWLNFVSPMLYTNDLESLDTWIDWETDQGRRFDLIYPILGAHKFTDTSALFNQIGLFQTRHIPGLSVFSISSINDQVLALLSKGPFRKEALSPHRQLSQAIDLQVQFVEKWLIEVLETSATESYRQKLEEVLQRLKQSRVLSKKDRHIKLMELNHSLNQMTGIIPAPMINEIESEISYILRLMASQQWLENLKGKYVPPAKPPVSVLKEARVLPEVSIKSTKTPLIIDGKFNEIAWKGSTRLTPFFLSGGTARPQVKTDTRLTYDDEAIYIAFQNEEPHFEKVRAYSRKEDNRLIFKYDDTVEVFLTPGQAEQYYHFAVNLRNTRYKRAPHNPNWNGKWESAVDVNDKGWSVEVKIPFKTLNSQKNETSWRGNFCRRRRQDIDSYHCWSFTFGYVHRTDRFGRLSFEERPEFELQANEL